MVDPPEPAQPAGSGSEPPDGHGTGGSTLAEVRRLPLSTVLVAVVAAAGVAAIVAGLLFSTGGDDGGGEADTASTLALEPATDAVGEPVLDDPYETFTGEQASLADYEGTPLVVNFFASWCVPCVNEMPAFEQVHQELGDEVAFVGLAVRESQEDSEGIVEETGVTYDLGRDPMGDLLTALGGVAMPTTVLVDADGTVTSVSNGELSAAELTEKVRTELLA